VGGRARRGVNLGPIMIKVFLLEPQTLLREGLSALLNTSSEIEVVGEEGDGRKAMRLIPKLKPDVALIRATMSDIAGVDVTRRILISRPQVRVVLLLADLSRQALFDCLQAGAAGVVDNNTTLKELLAAIDDVFRGGSYLSPVLASLVMGDYFRQAQDQSMVSDTAALSKRESDVLKSIAEGNITSQTAKLLHIGVRTVDAHRRNIMKKLNISSIAGLTKYAIREGFTSI